MVDEPPKDPLTKWESKQNPKWTDYDVADALKVNQSTIWRGKMSGRFGVDLMDQIFELTGIPHNDWAKYRADLAKAKGEPKPKRKKAKKRKPANASA